MRLAVRPACRRAPCKEQAKVPAVVHKFSGKSKAAARFCDARSQTTAPCVKVHGLASDETYAKAQPGDVLEQDYDQWLPSFNKTRRAGILLHPTSLPGPYGVGELGLEARNLIDWIVSAGMTVWQVLPMVPPDPMYYSPYSGTDSNGGNVLLISLDELVKDGLLDASDLPAYVPPGNIDFPAVDSTKTPLLKSAARRLLYDARFQGMRSEMQAFRESHDWVETSAQFDVLRKLPSFDDKAWWDWPEPERFRTPEAMAKLRETHGEELEIFVALQFLFDRQWKAIKSYANTRGVSIIGDMPIYVGGHSSDVWANQHLFELGPNAYPDKVSGVPPDAFSETGQLWGSPLYKWPAHRAEGYAWWAARLGRAFELYDETRVDHFRGFAGYWSVDAKAETAMVGDWRRGPGLELFDALKAKLGSVPILAEDLGIITTDVTRLREAIGAPGMVVLQFAWGGGPANVHLPHMHYENSYVYPGTHDNETTVGWWRGSATPTDKAYIQAYLGSDGTDIAWDFIRACMGSVSRTCVIMMQDVMRLDNSARMNTPGVAANNWGWRMGDSGVWARLKAEADAMKGISYHTGRLPDGPK